MLASKLIHTEHTRSHNTCVYDFCICKEYAYVIKIRVLVRLIRVSYLRIVWVIAKGDAREVGHTISDSSQYLACIMFMNLFSASINL